MNLIRRDKYENGCAAVVPKRSMKAGDFRSLYSLYQLKVNERSIPGTENPIKLQQVKGAAQDVTLRSVSSRRVQLRFIGEKRPRSGIFDAKGLSPIVRRSHRHHFTADDP